jgi:ABC-type multidrug transport system, ATPase and permease components
MKTGPAFQILSPVMGKYRFRIAGLFLLVTITVGIDLSQPVIVKEAIDRYISSGKPDAGAIIYIAGFYFLAVLIAFWLTYVQDVLLQSTGQSVLKEIRMKLFRHIQSLPIKYFDKNASGRIITNVVSDTEALNNFFSEFFPSTLRGVFTLVMIVFFMFHLNFAMALSCCIIVPVIGFISAYFQKKLRHINQQMRSRLSASIAFLAENLAGMPMIQIFRQESKQYRLYDEKNALLLKSTITENRYNMMFFFITELLSDFGVAALIWSGCPGVIRGEVSFGVLYAFVGYIRRFFHPINMITTQLNILQSMIVASERILQTLSEKKRYY